MVNIDTVYQKVLALANKEQRGYITPQEFNLFADQAQKEILDQYLYDINQFSRVHGNDTEHSDMLSLLEEKLGALKTTVTQAVTSGNFTLSSSVYKIGSIIHDNIEIEQVDYNKYKLIELSPLTRPTLKRPVYVNQNNKINIYPDSILSVDLSFIEKPNKPQWGYVVVNEKALFDPNLTKTTNFELHPMEESELVYKILKFAGITIEKNQVMSAGQGMEMAKVSQEKQ